MAEVIVLVAETAADAAAVGLAIKPEVKNIFVIELMHLRQLLDGMDQPPYAVLFVGTANARNDTRGVMIVGAAIRG
jgi:hypothetical protein